ncbi:4Fe-4S binding protein [Ideonella azotifigens]|uniref:4Fe-4S ferredoxin-type domain-containing protein n=2 Tax=Ideonella azotifigens TaxID=513160 RepID=A0ABP3UYU2_9BURK|nr:4Fe-4S binding protein [Ideonella azotifigens]MCD2340274.1 4Fe-4S binding protein [Ideonella azotifigens]
MPRPAPPLPAIDPTACTGCGRCIAACPPKVLWLDTPDPRGFGPKHAVLHDAAGCTGCAICQRRCPFDAIRMASAKG